MSGGASIQAPVASRRGADLHVVGAGQGHQSGRGLGDGAVTFQHCGQLVGAVSVRRGVRT